MHWKDPGSNSHSATYKLDQTGTVLLREFDGAERQIASNVVAIAFTIKDRLLTLYLEVKSSKGGTKNQTTHTYLRHMTES